MAAINYLVYTGARMKNYDTNQYLLELMEKIDKQIMKDFAAIIDEYGLIRLNVLLKEHGYKILKIEDQS